MRLPHVLKIVVLVLLLVAVGAVVLLMFKPASTDFPDTPNCGAEGIARNLDGALASPNTTCSLIISDQPDLAALPPSIGQLKQVTQLAIRHASLTTLPPEIGQLTELRTLDLRGNQLTVLPEEIGNLTQLHSLILSNNNLSDVPSSLANLQELISFELDGNQVSLEQQQQIQSWFTGFSVWFGAAPEDIPALAE